MSLKLQVDLSLERIRINQLYFQRNHFQEEINSIEVENDRFIYKNNLDLTFLIKELQKFIFNKY